MPFLMDGLRIQQRLLCINQQMT